MMMMCFDLVLPKLFNTSDVDVMYLWFRQRMRMITNHNTAVLRSTVQFVVEYGQS
jgi:hypothetical protein